MKLSSQLSDAEKFGFYSKKLREAQAENISLRSRMAEYENIIKLLREKIEELTKDGNI